MLLARRGAPMTRPVLVIRDRAGREYRIHLLPEQVEEVRRSPMAFAMRVGFVGVVAARVEEGSAEVRR